MNMFVGSAAAAASSSILPEAASASANGKPLDIDKARPELRDAVKALGNAYDELLKSDEIHHTAFELWRDWEKSNPRPGAPRSYRKWDRRADRYTDEIGLHEKLDDVESARRGYEAAQQHLAKVRAEDFEELAIKSAASMTYEGGILDDKPSRRHLRFGKQIVAYSVAFDTILLAVGEMAGSISVQ